MSDQTQTNDVVIRLEHVSKTYALYDRNVVDRFKDTFLPGRKKRYREFQALKDVSLEVKRDEILGIVGRNGAGKSTLLKIVSGITQPTCGTVETHGRIFPLLELGGGFNPEYTGRENVYFYCSLQGMRKEEIDAVYGEIVEFAELGEFMDVPVKKYSSGMRARLAFSVSINIDPDILILDEVLSVGDELFRRKCFARMEEFFSGGKTILFVSHAAQSVINICSRAILLHQGENIYGGAPRRVIPKYVQLLTNQSTDKAAIVDRIKAENERHQQSNRHTRAARKVPAANRTENSPVEKHGDSSYFVEDFRSKSARIVKVSNIDIYDIALLDNKFKPVNQVLPGEELIVRTHVRFNEVARKVSFGAIIYNMEGINQSGAYAPTDIKWIDEVPEDCTYTIHFHFVALLVPGVYFLRIVTQGLRGSVRAHISYVQDAITFRVLERERELQPVTMVTLFRSVELAKA